RHDKQRQTMTERRHDGIKTPVSNHHIAARKQESLGDILLDMNVVRLCAESRRVLCSVYCEDKVSWFSSHPGKDGIENSPDLVTDCAEGRVDRWLRWKVIDPSG